MELSSPIDYFPLLLPNYDSTIFISSSLNLPAATHAKRPTDQLPYLLPRSRASPSLTPAACVDSACATPASSPRTIRLAIIFKAFYKLANIFRRWHMFIPLYL